MPEPDSIKLPDQMKEKIQQHAQCMASHLVDFIDDINTGFVTDDTLKSGKEMQDHLEIIKHYFWGLVDPTKKPTQVDKESTVLGETFYGVPLN